MANLQVQTITHENFKPYGTVIAFTQKKNDGWEIILGDQSPGWRIALLECTRKKAPFLECHPDSLETFEPISGTALLIVAKPDSPDEMEVFLLHQPICLNKNVWHQVITITDTSLIKITENLDVTCVYHELKGKTSLALDVE